jgi:hypothetical protein
MKAQASMSSAMAALSLWTSETGTMIVASASPVPLKVLRTRVTVAPAAIQRSESHPQTTLDAAAVKKAIAPTTAILGAGKWRAFCRYAGSQVIRKYQK